VIIHHESVQEVVLEDDDRVQGSAEVEVENVVVVENVVIVEREVTKDREVAEVVHEIENEGPAQDQRNQKKSSR